MGRSGELMEKGLVQKDVHARQARMLVLIPLVAFLGLAALFVLRLGAGDPSRKLVPGLDTAEFAGQVTVLNVWASWCVPCRDEAPLLMMLAADRRLRVVGMNYKDQAENARRFLGRYGNPFAANGIDANGRAAIEWGVYGVPETFVISRDVRIAYKLIGPVTSDNLQTELKPAVERALANP